VTVPVARRARRPIPGRAPAGQARVRAEAQAHRHGRPAFSMAKGHQRAMRAHGPGGRAPKSGLMARAPAVPACRTAAPGPGACAREASGLRVPHPAPPAPEVPP
jgi:hypothetical protein